MKTVFRAMALALGAAGVLSGPVLAQEDAASYPSRPVTFVVPFPPGGPTDVIGRILAQGLSDAWGQPVVVENRPGAGSIVGTNSVAQSAPDGYTMGLVITAHLINPAIRNDLPYDTLRDFSPISQVGQSQVVLLASPGFEATNLDELIATAQARPGQLGYAIVGGLGSMTHLAGVLLGDKAGIELRPIPYDGSGPALIDVQANRLPLMFDLWGSARPHVESGALRLIANGSSLPINGHETVPSLPTLFDGYEATSIQGVVGPAGIPAPILEKMSQTLQDVLASDAVREALLGYSITPAPTTSAEWGEIIESSIARWTETARSAGVAAR
jgi:tripartite-type tricarboxylate transporter receptor subunit TctC